MMSDLYRSHAAKAIIKDHHAREMLFPAEAFHDHAWKILLAAFVAGFENNRLSERVLIDMAGVSTLEAQRCLYWLQKDAKVAPRCAGDDIKLTPAALQSLRAYLDQISVVGCKTLKAIDVQQR